MHASERTKATSMLGLDKGWSRAPILAVLTREANSRVTTFVGILPSGAVGEGGEGQFYCDEKLEGRARPAAPRCRFCTLVYPCRLFGTD
jgi:hypothetical protein